MPLTYDGVRDSAELQFEQQKAESSDLVRCWRQKEPAHQLTNLRNISIVIISSEASYHAAYDHCTSQYLTQAGVRHSFIPLAQRGIRGNGHMMMLEKNNLEIARVITEWINASVH